VTLRIGDETVPLQLSNGRDVLEVRAAKKLPRSMVTRVTGIVRRMFCLDDDYGTFYAAIARDPQLAWATAGAGRMLRSPTVFEDVVKTLCTTNCAWSGTQRMIAALVAQAGGAFPTPARMAELPSRFYRDVARAGYRGAYLRDLAGDVASGRLDLERLLPAGGLRDDEVRERLLSIDGIGPYAAAHVMMLLGRHGSLILDSWTRPTYLRRSGSKRASDRTIERRFARFGAFAGLAFWLFLTHDWLEEEGGNL